MSPLGSGKKCSWYCYAEKMTSRLLVRRKCSLALLQTLKILEDTGIETDDGKTPKAALISICGDNLGSHSVGGFTENCSCSKHFCGYCLIERSNFEKALLNLGPKRTICDHKESVQHLSATGRDIVKGVKFDSPFNSLKKCSRLHRAPPMFGS